MKSKSKYLLGCLGCLLFSLALMLGAMLGGNVTKVYAAEEDHKHCVCGGGVALGEHTACSDVTFLPYSGGDVTYDGETGTAYLYLVSDVFNSNILTINNGQTLYLCLNGYCLQNSARSNNVIDVNSGGKLILCDCKGTGWIGGRMSGSNSGAVWVESGTFTMYGGNLKNSSGPKNGGGLFLTGSGSATMYGGTISNNFAFADGGGVFLDGSSSFTMYGGTVSGNKATDEAGGVFVKTGTTFTMHGGVIDNNENGSNGAGVYVSGGKFIMNGGSIKGNTAAGRGGGICAENSGVITLNDGVIENNVAHGNGGGISSCWKANFTMNGGVVKNNECGLNGGGIFLFGNGGWKDATSTFTITGGTVEKNKAGGVGGGIYFYEYTNFYINGEKTIKVIDNEGSNLYLVDNKDYVMNLTSLAEGSHIGVSAMRNPWTISTANETDYSRFFSADSDDCHVGYNLADNKLALVMTPDFNKFTVKYDLNGGEGTVADSICKTFADGGSVQITSETPTRKCHTFLGWAESADATAAAYTAGDTLDVSGNKTLYAVWSLSHDVTKVDKVEPDCTHEGKEEYWMCACGKYFEDASATVEIADIAEWGNLPVRHTFTDLIAEVSATCTEDGYTYHVCEVCGYEERLSTIPATGHTAGDWIIDSQADCTHTGSKHTECTVCGAILEITKIPEIGHEYDYANIVWSWTEDYSEATATVKCIHDNTHTKEISAVITSVTKEATETEDGETVYTATVTVDGKVYTDNKTQKIPAKEQSDGGDKKSGCGSVIDGDGMIVGAASAFMAMAVVVYRKRKRG